MEEKLKIIDSILLALERIPVISLVDCERKLGIASGLRSLAQMIQQDEQTDRNNEKEACTDG